jgi:hypothetical protein
MIGMCVGCEKISNKNEETVQIVDKVDKFDENNEQSSDNKENASNKLECNEITKSNAKVLSIENKIIEGISDKKSTTSTDSNDTNSEAKDEKLKSQEGNIESKEESQFKNNDFQVKIKNISNVNEGRKISVYLDQSEVKIEQAKRESTLSKPYEVVCFSEPSKVEENNLFKLKVKNIDSNDISNFTLKYIEINSDGEDIKLEKTSLNHSLKPDEEAFMYINTEDSKNKVEIVGYVYNESSQNENVIVDLRTRKAIIN